MNYFFPIFSAILIIIPFYQPSFYFLAWLGLVPLFYSIQEATIKTSIKKGWLWGFVLLSGTGYWLYYPLNNFSGLPSIVVIFVLFILFALLAILYAIMTGLMVGIGLTPLLMAICWTALEYTRYRILPSFSVGFVGYTQTYFDQLLQWADLGGVFLITFIAVLINSLFYQLIFSNRKKNTIIYLLIIFIFIFGYGQYQLHNLQKNEIAGPKIGTIRTTIPQDTKWETARIDDNINHIFAQVNKILPEEPDLIISPETGFTFDIIRNEYYMNIVSKKIKEIKTPLQIGAQAIKDTPGKKYNSSFLISKNGEIIKRYNKNNLLPFGERIPFKKIVNLITGKSFGSLQSGEKNVLFSLDKLKWQTFICSEVMQPVPQYKINKTDFLINQSNEAWFESGVQQIMWTAAIFRAVETRKTLIKSGNYSYIGFISPTGNFTVNNNISNPTTITKKISLNEKTTLYQKLGNFMGYICLILLGLFILKNKDGK